jgi:DNA-binding phage protein
MPHARLTDPITSHEAAARVNPDRLTKTQEIIHKLLAEGMTDEELVNAFQAYCRLKGDTHVATPAGIRSRRNELYRAGKVEAIAYGKSTTGRRSIVWQAVNA